MSDEFFAKLDKRLAASDDAQAAAAARKASDRTFSENVIAELHPIASVYADGLRERGISVNRTANTGLLSFVMMWANGDRHALTAVPDLETGQLKFHFISTDHTTGREYSSTHSTLYGPHNWDVSHFRSVIERFIQDYVTFAEKHGGTG